MSTNLDKNNRIYNGLDVFGKGDNNSTTGLTVFNSGLTTSFIVRDDSKVGINTNELTRYLDINGDLRIRTINFNPEPPRMLVADANGYVYWDAKPVTSSYAGPSGDTFIISAYTSGCTLYLINNSGSTFTADTCNDVGPYKWSVGDNSIQPRFPADPSHNIVRSQYSVISSGGFPGVMNWNPYPWVSGNFIDGSGGSDGSTNQIHGEANGIHAGLKNCIFSGYNNTIVNGYANVLHSIPKQPTAGAMGYQKFVQYSSIINGHSNVISGATTALIGNGVTNRIGGLKNVYNVNTTDCTILNGRYNSIDTGGGTLQHAYILGGQYNAITQEKDLLGGLSFRYVNIGNGASNRISTDNTAGGEVYPDFWYCGIGNGAQNRMYQAQGTAYQYQYNDIVNGNRNSASTTTHSTIINGNTNKIQGFEGGSVGHHNKYNTIINGSGNTISTTGRYLPREYNTIVNGRNNDLIDISGSTIVAGSDIHGWHDDTVFSRNYSGQTYFSASTTTIKSVPQRAVNSVLNWGTHDDPNPADGTITYGFMKVFKYDSNAGGSDNPDDPHDANRPTTDDKPDALKPGETEEERSESSPPALAAGGTLNLRHNLNTESIIVQMFDHTKRMVGPMDPSCCETALTVTVTGPDTVSIYNGGAALNFGWYCVIMGM